MSKPIIKVACIGEAMIEISGISNVDSNVNLNVAGDTLNTAIYLKRLLGPKIEVSYLSVIGHDPFSEKIFKFIQNEHIGTKLIRRISSANSGIYTINNTACGERNFSYWRENSAARDLFNSSKDFASLDDFDYVYFSGITLAILSLDQKKKFFCWLENRNKEVKVIFDTNFREKLWISRSHAHRWIDKALKTSDVALPSRDDLVALNNLKNFPSFLRRTLNKTAPIFILKNGSNSSPEYFSNGKFICKLDHFTANVNAVDTTAAGDSFNAGFFAGLVLGYSPIKCLEQGHHLAQTVINFQGAICPKNEIDQLI